MALRWLVTSTASTGSASMAGGREGGWTCFTARTRASPPVRAGGPQYGSRRLLDGRAPNAAFPLSRRWVREAFSPLPFGPPPMVVLPPVTVARSTDGRAAAEALVQAANGVMGGAGTNFALLRHRLPGTSGVATGPATGADAPERDAAVRGDGGGRLGARGGGGGRRRVARARAHARWGERGYWQE